MGSLIRAKRCSMDLLTVLLHVTDSAVPLSREIEFWFLVAECSVRWSTLKLFGSASP